MKPAFIYQPPTDEIEIIHQDEHVLVVNKPAGLLSVPGRLPEHKDSLIGRLQQKWPDALTVHRLDMETSGVVIFALNKETQSHLSRQFQERLTQKIYKARIWGHPEHQQGEIDVPLICDWPNRPKQKIDPEHGKPAQTHWRIIDQDQQSSLVELKPITGRSHQLRVHMLHLGHPIIGDRLYAQGDALVLSKRLLLHSESLTIQPRPKQKPFTFTSITEI